MLVPNAIVPRTDAALCRNGKGKFMQNKMDKCG